IRDGPATKTAAFLMYVFNSIFFAAGSAVFSLGLFVQFNENIGDALESLEFSNYYNANAVLIVGAIMLMLTSVMGLIGTYFRAFKILLLYGVMSAASFALNMAGAIFLLLSGLEGTSAKSYISDTFYGFIYGYYTDMQCKYKADLVQENFECCGAVSASDYSDIHLPVPNTCRDQITGNQFSNSCGETVSRYLELYTGLSSGITLIVCFLQLFTFIFLILLYRGYNERRRNIEKYNE
ncbi:Tetraspanin/Peripherin, partial [Trinorchestia longiramus]